MRRVDRIAPTGVRVRQFRQRPRGTLVVRNAVEDVVGAETTLFILWRPEHEPCVRDSIENIGGTL